MSSDNLFVSVANYKCQRDPGTSQKKWHQSRVTYTIYLNDSELNKIPAMLLMYFTACVKKGPLFLKLSDCVELNSILIHCPLVVRTNQEHIKKDTFFCV